MTNRANGAGSVYQEKNGRWVAALTLTPDANGRRRVKRLVRKTKQLANKALIELQIEHSKKTLTLRSNETVEQFSQRWLTTVIPLRGLKPSTLSNYQQMIHYYIRPILHLWNHKTRPRGMSELCRLGLFIRQEVLSLLYKAQRIWCT